MNLLYYSWILLLFPLNERNVFAGRQKRTLIYPQPSSKIQLISGVGLPVAVDDISVTMGYVVKATYLLPTNVSDYTEPDAVILQRRKRDSRARWEIYTLLSGIMERFGGKSCVLRTICELTEVPLDRNFGFIEELLYVIFRPSVTNDGVSEYNREYFAAEKNGRLSPGSCGIKYPECWMNILDLITKYQFL